MRPSLAHRNARTPAEDRSPHAVVDDLWLLRAAVFFSLAVILHNADHLRRNVSTLPSDVFSAGTAGILLEVLLVVLICQRHRLAPAAAAAGGAVLAGGYLEVHFLPAHRWLSDSFSSASSVSPLSWAAASLEVAAALALSAVGLVVLRRRGGLASLNRLHPSQRGLAEALTHPLAAAMLLSQLATLAVSFFQAYG